MIRASKKTVKRENYSTDGPYRRSAKLVWNILWFFCYHKYHIWVYWLKTAQIYHPVVLEVRNLKWISLGWYQAIGTAVFFKGSGQNVFSCILQLLEGSSIKGLWSSFHFQVHPWPFLIVPYLWLFCLLSKLRTLCYLRSTEIILF